MDSKKSQMSLIIFLLLALLTCLSSSHPDEHPIVVNDFGELVSEESIIEIFRQWRDRHQKVYEHAAESEKRYRNFKRNLKYIIEKTGKKTAALGHRVGLNKFADLSNEEFKELYLSKVKKPINKRSIARDWRQSNLQTCDAPSSLDWRKKGVVTAVKDQGDCGSCWSFSTTGAIEGINAIVSGDLISLSEQELVDCDTTNYGCEGGYMDYAFEWVINNGGIDTEANYPYTGVDGTCNTTKEEIKVVSIEGYTDVDETDSALLCATVQQPISVGMDGSALDFQLYTGGIYDGDCSDDPNDIDHAVLVVGYGSENGEDYWIVKNSWGTEWGMEGSLTTALSTVAVNMRMLSAAPTPYTAVLVITPFATSKKGSASRFYKILWHKGKVFYGKFHARVTEPRRFPGSAGKQATYGEAQVSME
ncbi:hypothetical protein POTOM_039546 [Populus tomentosa]|uniref:Uncharacterized protein n=1 Tax=Populus tomentosa TaxID=118781 RepID=A0A8X8CJ17_POPTO|nr:hypothetical protein POTOM_039546 [Populus tomentosa]